MVAKKFFNAQLDVFVQRFYVKLVLVKRSSFMGFKVSTGFYLLDSYE